MPSKNKPHSTKFNFYEPENLSAVIGRVDSKSRMYARKMHELGWIYTFYGLFDGVNLSYSTMKYAFDVLLTNSKTSASDAMHEWMMTPQGIAVAATESITIITFSLLANLFDDKDKTSDFKRYIAILWPYIRDIMKSLKNSYKGVKSAIQLLNLLGGFDLNFLMLPVGFILGSLAAVNRLWFRNMYTLRKDMMDKSAQMFADIQKRESLTAEECKTKRAEMDEQCKQSFATKILAMCSSMVAGTLDLSYLYLAVLNLCPLAPPALIAMTVFCSIYSLGCVLSRMYEEYDYQRKLLIRHAKIDLALYSKEHSAGMQACFARLHEISKLLASGYKTAELLAEQHRLAKDMTDKIKIFSEKRAHLQSLMTLSYASAFMAGVINGLSAYRALASAIFAFSTVFFLTSTAFPPALLITFISTGMALLIGFIIHSIVNNYWHLAKQAKEENQPYERLSHILQVLKDVKVSQDEEISAEEVKQVICLGMEVKSSPKYYYEEWFEVIRSFFSGPAKGSKFVEYTLNPLQVADEHGHYHDTPVMNGLTVISSVVYALGLAARALTRGFGRDDSKQPTENPDDLAAKCKQAGKPASQMDDCDLSPSYDAGGAFGAQEVPESTKPDESPDKGASILMGDNGWGSFDTDMPPKKENSFFSPNPQLKAEATSNIEISELNKKASGRSSLHSLSFFKSPSSSGKTCKQQAELYVGGFSYVESNGPATALAL